MKMRESKRSFRLARPECPECQTAEARLVHSVVNWARVAVSTATGLFLWPVLAILWKCSKCQNEFKAE